MGRTFIRQDAQIASTLTTDVGFLDNISPSLANYQTNATDLANDLNNIRSQIQNFNNRDGAGFPVGKWYDDILQPSTFEGGAKRGISKVNQDLHDFEHKRVIRSVALTVDVTVPAAVRATGTLTGTVNFANGDTVSIDSTPGTTYKVYTFQTTLTNVDGNVQLGGSLAASLQNLYDAINLTGTPGTQYAAAMTIHPLVAAISVSGTQVGVRSKNYGTQGNLIRTDSSVADPDWGGATLTGGSGDIVVLGVGEIPTVTTAAVGNVTTLGTVVAYNASFGAATLAEVAGSTHVTPKNLCEIVDWATRDPILTLDGRRVYALLQSENATNGHTITATTPDRVQLTFVVLDGTADDLEIIPTSEMGGKQIMYTYTERTYLLALNEQDFLRGAVVDVGAGAVTPTRQNSYDNQGTTPVELGNNAYLDLNSAGIVWDIRDLTNTDVFKITEGSTGGTTTVQVAAATDFFDVNAVDNDFLAGMTVRSGGARPIDIGVNDGIIETTAGALEVQAKTTLSFDDGNKPGGWSLAEGVHLSDSGAEWTAFETAFGEVSLINAITQAYSKQKRSKVQAILTADVLATNDVNGPIGAGNTNVNLLPFNTVPTGFVTDVEVYLNGELLRNATGATEDVYPGSTPANGDLKFTFKLKGTGAKPDQLTVVVNGQ